jgi:hypothetical protein
MLILAGFHSICIQVKMGAGENRPMSERGGNNEYRVTEQR